MMVLSVHWEKLQGLMRQNIGIWDKQAIEFAQNADAGFDHRLKFDASLCQNKLSSLRLRFPEYPWGAFAESPLSRFDSLGETESVLSSNIFFWHLNAYLACANFIPRPGSVLEIGGGYGALARLFALAGTKYTIVDIPESLFFAEAFLRANGIKNVNLVPYDNLERLDRYDLAISQASFQEMAQEIVNSWAGFLKARVKYLYSLNYLAGGPFGTGTVFPREGWKVIREEVNPPVILEDISGTWLEAIYEPA